MGIITVFCLVEVFVSICWVCNSEQPPPPRPHPPPPAMNVLVNVSTAVPCARFLSWALCSWDKARRLTRASSAQLPTVLTTTSCPAWHVWSHFCEGKNLITGNLGIATRKSGVCRATMVNLRVFSVADSLSLRPCPGLRPWGGIKAGPWFRWLLYACVLVSLSCYNKNTIDWA